MEQYPLYITFKGRQVVIQARILEVINCLASNFKEMLADGLTGDLAGWFQVRRHDGLYRLQSNRQSYPPTGSLADLLCRLQYEITLQLIQAHPELLWFHAGAAAYQGQAVVMIGPSGRGKSTLVTQLCSQGWTYLTDDTLPLDPTRDELLPFPRLPWVRIGGKQALPPDQIQQLAKKPIELKPEAICRQAVRANTLIFPVYNPKSPTTLTPYSPAAATLELLQNCLNFVEHKTNAINYLCHLVKQVPAFRLSFNSGQAAAELLAQAYHEGRLSRGEAALRKEAYLLP